MAEFHLALFSPVARRESAAARAIVKALTAGDVLPRDGSQLTARGLLQAIRLAIAEEQNAIALYQAIADAAGDDAARAIFESIANEESVHVGEFQRLVEMLDGYEQDRMADGADEAEGIAEGMEKAVVKGHWADNPGGGGKHYVKEHEDKRHTRAQQEWERSGDKLPFVYHRSNQKIEKVDPDKLQSRDHGYYGRGFYVTSNHDYAKSYGRIVSAFAVDRDARIFTPGMLPGKAPSGLADEMYNTLYQHKLPAVIARGKKPEALAEELAALRESPLEWKSAADEYARIKGYDIVVYGAGEIVVKNDKVLTAVKFSKKLPTLEELAKSLSPALVPELRPVHRQTGVHVQLFHVNPAMPQHEGQGSLLGEVSDTPRVMVDRPIIELDRDKPELKAWMKTSKVRDARGRPLPVSAHQAGQGEGGAKVFTSGGRGGTKYYLNLTNPAWLADVKNAAIKVGVNGSPHFLLSDRRVVAELRRRGYDGAMFTTGEDDTERPFYAVFDEAQLKPTRDHLAKALEVLVKAFVRAHTGKTKSGKTYQVASYYTKREPKPKAGKLSGSGRSSKSTEALQRTVAEARAKVDFMQAEIERLKKGEGHARIPEGMTRDDALRHARHVLRQLVSESLSAQHALHAKGQSVSQAAERQERTAYRAARAAARKAAAAEGRRKDAERRSPEARERTHRFITERELRAKAAERLGDVPAEHRQAVAETDLRNETDVTVDGVQYRLEGPEGKRRWHRMDEGVQSAPVTKEKPTSQPSTAAGQIQTLPDGQILVPDPDWSKRQQLGREGLKGQMNRGAGGWVFPAARRGEVERALGIEGPNRFPTDKKEYKKPGLHKQTGSTEDPGGMSFNYICYVQRDEFGLEQDRTYTDAHGFGYKTKTLDELKALMGKHGQTADAPGAQTATAPPKQAEPAAGKAEKQPWDWWKHSWSAPAAEVIESNPDVIEQRRLVAESNEYTPHNTELEQKHLDQAISRVKALHTTAVDLALAQKKIVPPAVLYDYPELAAKHGIKEITVDGITYRLEGEPPRWHRVTEGEKPAGATGPVVETFHNGVRQATRVVFPDGRTIAFVEKLPKAKAIEQAMEQLKKMDGEGEQKGRTEKKPAQSTGNTKTAARLRSVADGMEDAIENKLHPAIGQQNATARRSRIAGNMWEEGMSMRRVQQVLRNLADLHEAGTVPPELAAVSSRIDVEQLLRNYKDPRKDISNYDARQIAEILSNNPQARVDADGRRIAQRLARQSPGVYNERLLITDAEAAALKRAVRDIKALDLRNEYKHKPHLGDIFQWYDEAKRWETLGIYTKEQAIRAFDLISALGDNPREAEERKAREQRKLEQDIALSNYKDYFPTPKPIVSRMIDEADIEPGMSVLEPSAGVGHIADGAKAAGADVTVVEIASKMRDLLKMKGHNVAGDDALTHQGQYDRVIMNPPFSGGADIEHVQRAFNANLKPGGRLVAIMSEGPFFRSDKKAAAFREWLEANGGTSERLPAGTFTGAEADRQTGVNTRLVVINKPVSNVVPFRQATRKALIPSFHLRLSARSNQTYGGLR